MTRGPSKGIKIPLSRELERNSPALPLHPRSDFFPLLTCSSRKGIRRAADARESPPRRFSSRRTARVPRDPSRAHSDARAQTSGSARNYDRGEKRVSARFGAFPFYSLARPVFARVCTRLASLHVVRSADRARGEEKREDADLVNDANVRKKKSRRSCRARASFQDELILSRSFTSDSSIYRHLRFSGNTCRRIMILTLNFFCLHSILFITKVKT